MKSEKVLRTLSIKVRHKSILIPDQSTNLKIFSKPILSSSLSPLPPFFELNSSSSKTFYFNGIKKKQMYRRCLPYEKLFFIKQNGEKQSLNQNYVLCTMQQLKDYRIVTLRSSNLFYRRQIKHKMIRPLLDFKRESITMVCKDLSISVYPDKSNRLLQYSRNRIRKQIIPSIKYFFNPQVENSLFKIAELLKKEQFLIYSLLKNTSVNVRSYL